MRRREKVYNWCELLYRYDHLERCAFLFVHLRFVRFGGIDQRPSGILLRGRGFESQCVAVDCNWIFSVFVHRMVKKDYEKLPAYGTSLGRPDVVAHIMAEFLSVSTAVLHVSASGNEHLDQRFA